MKRLIPILGGVIALCAGSIVASGCNIIDTCEGVDFGDGISNGVYEISGAERDELEGATVEIDDQSVSISYSLEDGSSWVVDYNIVERTP